MSSKKAGTADSRSIETTFSSESIKCTAESIGCDKPPDDALQFLADNVSIKVKQIIQEAVKFTLNSRSQRLSSTDVDNALRLMNIEPVYGFSRAEFTPYRGVSGGGRELFFQEDVELDLEEVVNQTMPKLPLSVALKAHWLAVDGVQPFIPENPPPNENHHATTERTSDPTDFYSLFDEFARNDGSAMDATSTKSSDDRRKDEELQKAKDIVRQKEPKFKSIVVHELSVEQQLYYGEITEACVGSNENKRTEAHLSLSTDTGLYQLLPRFATFITEGVKVNVAQNNLALLIYLLRMIKALMENPTLHLHKYLHELIPSVLTCILSKKLCPRPDFDNHWALRDFAGRLLAQICKKFSSSTNNIQSRAIKILCREVYAEGMSVSRYGAVVALCELGFEMIKFVILPRLRTDGDIIKRALESSDTSARALAEHLQTILIKFLSVYLSRSRVPPDVLADYHAEYGHLGPALYNRVAFLRKSGATGRPVTTPSGSTAPSPVNPDVKMI